LPAQAKPHTAISTPAGQDGAVKGDR